MRTRAHDTDKFHAHCTVLHSCCTDRPPRTWCMRHAATAVCYLHLSSPAAITGCECLWLLVSCVVTPELYKLGRD